MDVIRTLPVDPGALVAGGAILLVSVLLVVAGGSRLPTRWWIGALMSGVIVLGVAMFVVLAVSALDSGDAPLRNVRWWALAAASGLGFLAGTDVQLLIGILRRVQGGTSTVIAGALLGPIVVIGGFLLLVRP
jgi:hypothetical protein